MICFFSAICDYFPVSGYLMNVLYVVRLSLVVFPLLLCPIVTVAQVQPELKDLADSPAVRNNDNPLVVCRSFNDLNTRIRDGNIAKIAAQAELRRLLAEVRNEYFRSGGANYQSSEWVFPLSGHDVKAVGPGTRHGFNQRGYDYFSGNRHGGHPSYDIFIWDRNQDSRDDRSGKPVRVVSLTGGIVVALEKEWEQESRLRGGKYIWIYDPANDLLVYYAHNGEVSVELGTVVKPGDELGTVGRSGLNAAKKRSPTHLHLTVLRVKDGRVEPLKVYRELSRARTVTASP
jgi:murein DD-endopeptidase MepM/ murein hydrolase activator NlpD